MPIVRLSRRLREAPGGDPVRLNGSVIDLPEGTPVEILEVDTVGWTKIRAVFGVTVEGWISSDGIADGDAFSLSKAVFAAQCVDSGATYGANAYYLMMVALQRTNVKSFLLGRPDGFVGPFALTSAEWDAMRNVPDSLLNYAEEQITVWTSQVAAFAVSTHAMQIRLSELTGKEPSTTELFFAQSFGSAALKTTLEVPTTAMADIVASFDEAALIKEGVDVAALRHRSLLQGKEATGAETITEIDTMLKPHFDEAVDFVRPAADKYLEALASAGIGLPQSAVALNYSSPYLDSQIKRANAEKITTAFARAGYHPVAQLAAVANAIGESRLDHQASNTKGEDSHGLFQLNRKGGVGTGHSVAELKDADKNIAIMLNYILEPNKKDARHKFLSTKKLAEAVQIFVYDFEKPADKARATAERIEFAKSIKL